MNETCDTGSALVRAILANLDDDAPWLIYADWLEENGRETHGAALRAHMGPIRNAVRMGAIFNAALNFAAELPPGVPYSQGRSAPTPPVVSSRVSDTGTTRPANNSSGTGAFWVLFIVFKLLVLLANGTYNQAERQREDRSSVERARPTSRIAPESWQQSEVVGFTFRLVDDLIVRSFHFARDGSGEATLGVGLGQESKYSFGWRIDEFGVLEINVSGELEAFRLLKVSSFAERYKVIRLAMTEVYLRQPG